MNSNNAAGTDAASSAQDSRRTGAGLDSKYGAIGISAVAAALRYKSETKSADSSPAAAQPASFWLEDLAA